MMKSRIKSEILNLKSQILNLKWHTRIPDLRFKISAFCIFALFLVLTSACGQEVSSTASAAPIRAFVASDFDNNDEPDSDEFEVQVIERDPFQMPGGLPGEEHAEPVRAPRKRAHIPVRESALQLADHIVSTIELVAPILDAISPEEAAPIEVTWPDIKLSGMLRDAQERWAAVINGCVIREGEWITTDVRLARADQHGAVLMHRSGATRRINVKDGRRNG